MAAIIPGMILIGWAVNPLMLYIGLVFYSFGKPLRMHICMYVGMYICIYVYMHVCMYVYMYVCMYICMYVCMYVCT